MEHISPYRSPSILSLVKRLAGERWIPAYERLLDITGEHRNGTVPRTARKHLGDVASELLVVGDVANATDLKRLTNSLSIHAEHSDCLLVLLLCADKAIKKHRKVPVFPVGEVIHPSDSSLRDTKIQPFTSEPSAASKERPNLPFTTLSHDIDSSDPADCIAGTSRCEHESYSLWLQSNLGKAATPDEVHTSEDLRHPITSTTFPDTSPASKHESAKAYPYSFTEFRHATSKAPQESAKFDVCKVLLHNVCHMCLMGPDVDAAGTTADTLLRPTSLLAASAISGVKLSIEQSHTFTRRRILVNEFKAWSQRLRAGSNRQNPAPFSSRALMCGLAYQSVLSFAPAYLSKQSSRALKALVSYVALCTDEYLGAVLDAAVPTCSDPAALDLFVLDTAESFSVRLREIARVLDAVEETDGSSERILQAVSGQLRRFPASVWLQELFLHITEKYENVLKDWVTQGSCTWEESTSVVETNLDPSIATVALKLSGGLPEAGSRTEILDGNALFSENQALFFRRAGYGRAILRELTMFDSSLAVKSWNDESPEKEESTKGNGDDSSVRILPSAASHGGNMTQSDAAQAFTRPLEEACSDPQASSGQSLNGCSNCFPLRDKMVIEREWNRRYLPNERNPMVTKKSLEPGRIECAVYPTLYAELTVDQFRAADDSVQRKIFEIFVRDLEVFAHLEFIQKFVLLGRGDFANALVEQVNAASLASESSEVFLQNRKKAALTFYGSVDAGKSHIRSLLYLRRCCRAATYLFNTDTERFASRLTLDISSGPDGPHSHKELWAYQVEFGYEVPNPLKLILSADSLSMYSKIHGFFLRVNRAKMSLRNLFMMTRRRSVLDKLAPQNAMRDVHVRAILWLFCMDSEQFVNKLGGFFMDQVIGSAWESFQGVWTSCENVWALRDAHRRFLEGSVQRCLLDPRQKNLCNVISGGFEIIHKVERDVIKLFKSHSLVAKVANTLDLVSSASASLRRRSLFVADILERLSEAGTWHATSSAAW